MRKVPTWVAVLSATLLFSLAGRAVAAPERLLAFTGGVVVDPSGNRPDQTVTLIVRRDRILRMGPHLSVPRGARVVDLRGAYVTPGLWDMHAHLLVGPPIAHKLEGYVGHGVLALRDAGGYPDPLFALKREIGAGRLGPELVLAGPTLNGEPAAGWHRVIATESEARTAVRELKRRGVGVIKTHRATKRDVFLALLDEARRQDLPVMGHVPLGVSWDEAARAGLQSIEHAATIVENMTSDPREGTRTIPEALTRLQGRRGDEIIAAMAAAKTYFDPTLIHYQRSIEAAAPEKRAGPLLFLGQQKLFVRKAYQAGVPILTGTDVLTQAGRDLIEELKLLDAAGLPARAILQAATTNAAAAARRPDLGRIAPGGPASFLVLRRDPRVDITALQAPEAVVLRGRLIGAEDLARLRALDR